jgi:DNA-binding transcriptional MerR regulator
MEKQPDAFRTIGEAATDLDLPQHVLRFWETRFTQIKPMKGGGGRRYYRIADIELLRAIKKLLYQDGYTIKGVQRLLREKGGKALLVAAHAGGQGIDTAQLPDLFAEQKGGAEAPAAHDASLGAAESPTTVAVTDLPDAATLLDLLLGEIDACRSMLRQARAG